MKILVTGVNGQLGHDVVNELIARGHEGIGSGSSAAYHGVADGSAAAVGPYVQMDITDEKAVQAVMEKRVCKIFCVNAKASCSKLIYNPY